MIIEHETQKILIFLATSFPTLVSESSSPFWFVGKLFFVSSFLTSNPASWIACELQVGRTLTFLLSRSNFKYETRFGFLSPNYTGHVVCFL